MDDYFKVDDNLYDHWRLLNLKILGSINGEFINERIIKRFENYDELEKFLEEKKKEFNSVHLSDYNGTFIPEVDITWFVF